MRVSSLLALAAERRLAIVLTPLLATACNVGDDETPTTATFTTAGATLTATADSSATADDSTTGESETATDTDSDTASDDTTTTDSAGCAAGTEGCPCTPGGWCDEPLMCVNNVCYPPGPVCGDGVLEGSEQCDDGNMLDTDTCVGDCVPAQCGDGFVQTGVEECDDGNSEDEDGCTNACVVQVCGDGIMQGEELCDDGNLINEDTCLDDCQPNVCGDGYVNAGIEACDDGNSSDTDECTSTCALAACGDGFVQNGVEECDDANIENTDECVAGCLDATCGDGFIQAEVEFCDDANAEDNDACISCVVAFCGDGYEYEGVEECDDGNIETGDGCSPTCLLEACQDAISLGESDRNVTFNDGNGGVELCDDSKENLWYRFEGLAGTRIPNTPQPKFACGTDSPGWMMGEYPTIEEGAVDRTVCFAWTNDDCTWSVPIKALNCGTTYVFQLPNVPQCALRYCGTN